MYFAFMLLLMSKLPKLNPLVGAGIYAVTRFFVYLMIDRGIGHAFVSSVLSFFLAFGYFIVLRRLDRSIFRWFIFAVLGAILIAMI